MVTPFFTIAVTTFDRPDILKQTLRSICDQTFDDFEVLVGNDYVDEPLTVDRLGIQDSRIRIVNHPENLGEAENMNTLLRLGRGRYFTWQCDDDLYAPTFLADVHSALGESDHPVSVFTAHRTIYGTAYPEMPELHSRTGRVYSGREFLRMYWAGKLQTMGCTGAFPREYLIEVGGVECLADTHHPLYSEHLLLLLAGLQEHVVHIDAQLVVYRVHDAAWGCTTNDLLLYEQACTKLLERGVDVFANPRLRDDFGPNISAILSFLALEFFGKARAGEGCLSRHKVVPFFFSLRRQFTSLEGSPLRRIALAAWLRTGLKLSWWLCTRFNIKAALAEALGSGAQAPAPQGEHQAQQELRTRSDR